MRAILIAAVSVVLLAILAVGGHFALVVAASSDGDIADAANAICVTCHGE